MKKKIKSITAGRCVATVYRDSEWDEYVVKFSPGPKKLAKDSDGLYHTNAKDDAIATAEFELRRMQARGECGPALAGARGGSKRAQVTKVRDALAVLWNDGKLTPAECKQIRSRVCPGCGKVGYRINVDDDAGCERCASCGREVGR